MATHSRKLPADPNLALRLNHLLRKSRLSPVELSRKIGVGRGTISHWLSGRFEPARSRYPRLAEALGTTVEKLMGTNLSDAQKEREAAWLKLLLASPIELAELIEKLGPDRALAALQREQARPAKKR